MMKNDIGPGFRVFYFVITFAVALRSENDTARRILVKSLGENLEINVINEMTKKIVENSRWNGWTDEFTFSLLHYIFSHPTDPAPALPCERTLKYIRFTTSGKFKMPKTEEYLTNLILA
jgi:hypothetical protein